MNLQRYSACLVVASIIGCANSGAFYYSKFTDDDILLLIGTPDIAAEHAGDQSIFHVPRGSLRFEWTSRSVTHSFYYMNLQKEYEFANGLLFAVRHIDEDRMSALVDTISRIKERERAAP